MSGVNVELMTVEQVAKLWGVTEATIVRQFDRGNIRGFVVNPGAGRRHIRLYADSVYESMGLKPPEPTNGQMQEAHLSHITTTA